MLQLDNVIKKLGRYSFGPYSLCMHHNESVAIVGPNGAGKSTLLKLMSGTYQPNTGRIIFNHRPLSFWTSQALSEKRAVLSQSQDIAFALAVRTVIGLGRVARKTDPDHYRIVAHAADLFGLTHHLDQTIDTLSGGELARVHLARVVAQLWDVEQGFILMDEPMAAVDPGCQDFLFETLMRFARLRKHAVIAIMHDLNHALRYFNRLVLVHPTGKLELVNCDEEAKNALEHLFKMRLSCLKDEQGDLVMLPLRGQPANPQVKELIRLRHLKLPGHT
jgi:iron complex transport system ATP-binding protein